MSNFLYNRERYFTQNNISPSLAGKEYQKQKYMDSNVLRVPLQLPEINHSRQSISPQKISQYNSKTELKVPMRNNNFQDDSLKKFVVEGGLTKKSTSLDQNNQPQKIYISQPNFLRGNGFSNNPSISPVRIIKEQNIQIEMKLSKKINQEMSMKQIWDELDQKLPLSDSHLDKEKRIQLFTSWDPNRNGYLSLAEIDLGIKSLLRCEKVFRSKPAIIRAFQLAKNIQNKIKSQQDFLVPQEFRTFLISLRQYFEYFIMFEKVDISQDRRLNILEFKQVQSKLREWGVKIKDPTKAFYQIDFNNGGLITFEEFCDWAIQHRIDLIDDKENQYQIDKSNPKQYWEKIELNYQKEPRRKFLRKLSDKNLNQNLVQPKNESKIKADSLIQEKPLIKSEKINKSQQKLKIDYDMQQIENNHLVDEDLQKVWLEMNEKLPIDDNPQDFKRRMKMFEEWDPNSNNYLSLAECDLGIKNLLVCEKLFKSKQAILRAFQRAKIINDREQKNQLGQDYIQKNEFRAFLIFIKQYFQFYIIFSKIDKGNDQRIDQKEFQKTIQQLKIYGLEINQNSESVFQQIDINQGGQILFDEFSTWAINNNLYIKNSCQKQYPIDEKNINDYLDKINDSNKPNVFSKIQIDKNDSFKFEDLTPIWRELDQKLPLENSPQDIEKRVKMQYNHNHKYSFNHYNFINRFQLWDPNNNKYLSLAEIDLGIKKLLECEKVFKSKPAILRAFQMAKVADNREQKDIVGIEYITKAEFRTFLIYLKKYFQFFLIFEKIDSQQDQRVDLQEFKEAAKKFKNFNLNIQDPVKVFNQIDKNNGGQILFIEFTEWAIINNLSINNTSKKDYPIDPMNPQQYLEDFSIEDGEVINTQLLSEKQE